MLSKVIQQSVVDKAAKLLENAENIVIVTHLSPDGDALGSSLGLLHFLETQEKEVHIIVPNAFPDFFRWMPGAKDIVRYDKYTEFANKLIAGADLICGLDFNTLSRIGAAGKAVGEAQCKKLLIDHHLYPEDFCDVTVSHPEMSSTSELVFRLICCMGYFEDIHLECAQCIYTGMMTDTGGFTYNSNNRETYFIISELLSKGIDKDDIYRKVFNTYSEGRLRLMGYVLYEKMQVFPQFRTALITLEQHELTRFHSVKGDTEGFVNLPLQMKGICFSVFLREDAEKGMIKVSLRSVGNFPCNQVAAEYFGGGGHRNAAGGEVYGPMEEAVRLLNQALVKYEGELLKN